MTAATLAQPAVGLTKTFQAEALSVRVYADPADLARDVARIAQKHLQETLAAHGSAAAILATGNSQIKFLEELIRLGGVDWSKITLFHMDEYLCISAHHKCSLPPYMRERVDNRVKPRLFHCIRFDAPLPSDVSARDKRFLPAQPIDRCC